MKKFFAIGLLVGLVLYVRAQYSIYDGTNKMYPFNPATSASLFSNARGFTGATTGNATIAPSVTLFFPIDSSANPMTWTTDVSGGTRSLMPIQTLFTNMLVIASAAPGSGGCTITLMSNGVATALSCKLTTGTFTNDSAHTVTIPAGTELGWKLQTGAGVTAAKYSIGVETRQ